MRGYMEEALEGKLEEAWWPPSSATCTRTCLVVPFYTLWCDAELDELVFVCANKHVKKQNHFNSVWCSQIDIIIRHLNICFNGNKLIKMNIYFGIPCGSRLLSIMYSLLYLA